MNCTRAVAMMALLIWPALAASQDNGGRPTEPVWRAPAGQPQWTRSSAPRGWFADWTKHMSKWSGPAVGTSTAAFAPSPKTPAATIEWKPAVSKAKPDQQSMPMTDKVSVDTGSIRQASGAELEGDIFKSAAESLDVLPRETTIDPGPPIFNPEDVHILPREMFLPARLPQSSPSDAPTIPSQPTGEKILPEEAPRKASLGGPLRKRNAPAKSCPIETALSECSTSICDPMQPFMSRLETRDELLIWRMRGDSVPVLAATSATDGSGALGDPGTVVLFDSGSLNNRAQIGYRWRGAYWFADERKWGLETGFFFLGRRGDTTNFSSNDYSTLTRPVYALNTNQEAAETVASPGLSTGVLSIDSTSRLWGLEANALRRICFGCGNHFDVILGYRYLSLVERIQITEFITAGANAPDPAGTQIFVQDRFHTNNAFHGGQIGARYEQRWGRFSADIRATIAIGATIQVLEIGGNQVRTRPGEATERFTGGLMATPTNIGHFSRNRFSVVPEVGLNLGCDITPRVRALVGYNFLYWSSVLRPGQQIDRVIDVSQVPNAPAGIAPTGQQRPGVLFDDSGLWVQGVNLGLEFRW